MNRIVCVCLCVVFEMDDLYKWCNVENQPYLFKCFFSLFPCIRIIFVFLRNIIASFYSTRLVHCSQSSQYSQQYVLISCITDFIVCVICFFLCLSNRRHLSIMITKSLSHSITLLSFITKYIWRSFYMLPSHKLLT